MFNTKGWRDGSDNEILASQAWAPEFEPQDTWKLTQTCNPQLWGSTDRWILEPAEQPG